MDFINSPINRSGLGFNTYIFMTLIPDTKKKEELIS